MKKSIVSLLLLCVAFSLCAASVDTVEVYSKSMQKKVRTVVVKPDAGKQEKYPVVYLLHGYAGNEKTWIHSKTDVKGLAERFQVIIVCPDGKNSWYWDSPVVPSYRYETFVSGELPVYVDAHYSTISDRRARAITGLSMGGHGALWNAIRHQDVFGAAGSMSGGVDIRPFPGNWEMKNQLGDYETNKEVWDNHTVINQLDKLQNGSLAILVDCGVDDFFLEVNNNLHRDLLKRGIGHDYTVRPGQHDFEYWANAVEYQFLFFSRYFQNNLKTHKLK